MTNQESEPSEPDREVDSDDRENWASDRERDVGTFLSDIDGYDPRDPKSPGFVDRFADVWDAREGK